MSEEATRTPVPQGEEKPTRQVLQGRLISGMPLPVAAQKRISQHFETLLGSHVRLDYQLEPSLIAGIRVELNGCAYDGSLLGQLTSVRKLLTRYDEEEL